MEGRDKPGHLDPKEIHAPEPGPPGQARAGIESIADCSKWRGSGMAQKGLAGLIFE